MVVHTIPCRLMQATYILEARCIYQELVLSFHGLQEYKIIKLSRAYAFTH